MPIEYRKGYNPGAFTVPISLASGVIKTKWVVYYSTTEPTDSDIKFWFQPLDNTLRFRRDDGEWRILYTQSVPKTPIYGYLACGYSGMSIIGNVYRFDDSTNVYTGRSSATARYGLAGYTMNNYGFTTCGVTTNNAKLGTTERFSDVENVHVGRASATARGHLAGYAVGQYGFSSCGEISFITGLVERFDDSANVHVNRVSATARYSLTGYSAGGYGFLACGRTVSGLVNLMERFDDVTNSIAVRANAPLSEELLASFAI